MKIGPCEIRGRSATVTIEVEITKKPNEGANIPVILKVMALELIETVRKRIKDLVAGGGIEPPTSGL